MNRIIFLLFTFFLSTTFADGFWDRASDMRTDLPENIFQKRKLWGVDLSLGYSENSGNIEQINGYTNISLFKVSGDFSYYLQGSALYSSFGESVVQNRRAATLRIDWRRTAQFKWFAFNTHGSNEFLKLNYRTTFGAGPWFDFAGKSWKNGLSVVPVVLVEQFEGQDSSNEAAVSLRNVFRYELNSVSSIGFDFFYAPRMKEVSDYHLYFQSIFETKIYRDLIFLQLMYTLEYDSRPAAGVRSADRTYMTAISFHLGK